MLDSNLDNESGLEIFLSPMLRRNSPLSWQKSGKDPTRVVRQLGPLNYQVVLEDTGQDVRTVHVCNLKPFYPSAEDLEKMEKQRVLDILQESSEEEDFLGF